MENRIYETKNYKEFKFVPQNRKTVAMHVAKLCESIKKKNLIKDFPIIVNKEMEILDGQNRLQALEQLGLPVYYRFALDMGISDISLVNTVSKKWALDDYLHQYTSQGHSDYLKFKDFMDWAGIKSPNSTLKIIKGTKFNILKTSSENGSALGGDSGYSFKSGNFKYPDDDSYARKTVINLKTLASYTERKDPYDRALVTAYDTITKDKNFDFDRLTSKLPQYPIGVYKDANSLIDILEKAYNYNVPHEKKGILRRY